MNNVELVSGNKIIIQTQISPVTLIVDKTIYEAVEWFDKNDFCRFIKINFQDKITLMNVELELNKDFREKESIKLYMYSHTEGQYYSIKIM